VRGPVWGGVGQEHGVAVVGGEAGVVAGAAPAAPAARAAVPARSGQGLGAPRGDRGPRGGRPLGLTQLLDQEPLVPPLLVAPGQTKG
jgi:hypothetical protein